jgi:superfamily II DNA helicase RecQ
MGKRVNRVQYTLDPKGIKELPFEEIRTILRGADPLIMHGGRTLLAKVLKGSKEKKVLELGLDHSPAYGAYKDLSLDEITARIDWAVLNGYLAIDYDYRLPLLIYTDRGWEIEKDTYTDELLEQLQAETKTGKYEIIHTLKDRDRRMILLLLAKIEATGDKRFIPALEAWAKLDYKKVQKAIREVISTLSQAGERIAEAGQVVDLAEYRRRKELAALT